MRHILKIRPGFRCALAGLLLAGAGVLTPSAARADAVDDLRQALPMRPKDLDNPPPAVTEFRRLDLQKKIDALKTPGDLRRALALEEWKDSISVHKSVRDIDADMRRQVATRLTKAIRDVIQRTDDPNARIAVANLIAEIGPTIRSAVDGDRFGFARSLTPETIQLARDKDLGVRQEGLRALGNIFPKAQDVVPVFKNALATEAPGPKRLAADGLGQLVRVVTHLSKRGRSAPSVDAGKGDVLESATEVLRVTVAGLQDADPLVRATTLDAVTASAQALADLIPDGLTKKELPTDKKTLLDIHDFIAREIKELTPAIEALRGHGPILARLLADPELEVRLKTAEALENIGNARVRLQNRVNSVDPVDGDDRGNRAALGKVDTLAEFIANNLGSITKLLHESDTRLRRQAIDFLEIIEDSAVPALPALIQSLSDPDRFVRWSAARALGNINVKYSKQAVPALSKLLTDPDLNVRLTTAKTIETIGPEAHAAVPALGQAITSGDSEARVACMYALQRIGPEHGKAVVPQLIEGLTNTDPRVRRAAAQTLGSFGGAAKDRAIPALRRALGDDDQEVRVNASDAILAILQGDRKY